MKNYLKLLIKDQDKVNQKLYSAGPYWKSKNISTLRAIRKNGIKNFRGLNSGISNSFVDSLLLDIRNEYNLLGTFFSNITKLPILSGIFNDQIKVSKTYLNKLNYVQQILFKNNLRVKKLIKKYKINNSTKFGCVQKFAIKNREYSYLYLEMANRIDHIGKFINFKKIRTYLEIGGGFGSNIHFILQNFKNIKKIIYIDVVPNIFIGTEYLRYFFGKSVKDYSYTKNLKKIKFKRTNGLEIYCIPPWEIEKIDENIDHFHNACSFVEMPKKVVYNYVKYIKKNNPRSISLVTYKIFNKKTSLNPDFLKKLFKDLSIINENYYVLKELSKKNIYLIKKFNERNF